MNILFVDGSAEERARLAGIIDAASQRGIGSVFTAGDIESAWKHIQEDHINIVFSAISLPDGDGVGFLRDIREFSLRIVAILYEPELSFARASRAMHLKAFDYLQSPVSPEKLREVLGEAMEEAAFQQRIEDFYQSIVDVRKANRNLFWDYLLTYNANSMSERVYRLHIVGRKRDYSEDNRFFIAILSLADKDGTSNSWKSYAFYNVYAELFSDTDLVPEAIFPLQEGDWCCVLRKNGADGAQVIREKLQALSDFVSQYLSSWLNCYYSGETSLRDARGAYARLLECFEDDVTSKGAVYAAEEYRMLSSSPSPPLKEWELLLSYQQADELVRQINDHLDRSSRRDHINMEYLEMLQADILQLIQTVLAEKSLNFHSLSRNSQYKSLYGNALRSTEHMKQYLEFAVRAAVELLQSASSSVSVVGRIKNYINSHLTEEISRGSVAQLVFLNPDYVARIFKKETGQSISAYVKEQRIHKAKKLLAETSIPVNEIAMRVGYDNFSYFTHLFHRHTGMTPKEYRKHNMAGQ